MDDTKKNSVTYTNRSIEVGDLMYGRMKTDYEDVFGIVRGVTRVCTLDGCRGVRVRVL